MRTFYERMILEDDTTNIIEKNYSDNIVENCENIAFGKNSTIDASTTNNVCPIIINIILKEKGELENERTDT